MQNSNEQSLEKLPDILTAEIIAKFLGIGYVKCLTLIKFGGLPHLKIGNTYRVSKKKLIEWIEQNW